MPSSAGGTTWPRAAKAREAGEKHFKEALSATDRLTLRERLWIQAVAEDSRGNRERAVQAYETYLDQYPDDVRALFRVSWTRMATLGEFDKAIDGFKRVVALEPNDSSAWVNLASSYGGKGDLENAMRELRESVRPEPFPDPRRVHQPRIRIHARRNGEDRRSRSGVRPHDEGSGSAEPPGPRVSIARAAGDVPGTIRGGRRTAAPCDRDRSDRTTRR